MAILKRCTIIIPDAGPFNSLWVADRLDILLELKMPLVVVDAVYDEVTSDQSYRKDRDVRAFIDTHRPPFVLEATEIGQLERRKRETGVKLKRNAGELAILDFMTVDSGMARYVETGDPVAILFEDAGFRIFRKPPNLHLISTVGLLRGLERVGVIASADEIIHEMTHPSKPGRRGTDARIFNDMPAGIDDSAAVGSTWLP